ncbi:MAG: hypothetical protein R3B96_21085 [Pirellulaceae bacterium]
MTIALGVPSLLLFCVCAGFIGLYFAMPEADRRLAPDVDSTPPSEIVVVSADNLFREFVASESEARQAYFRRVVEVSGTVREADEFFGIYFVTFENDLDRETSVICQFSPEYKHQARAIRPGDSITVRGRCAGWISNVSLEDCRLSN